MPLFTLILNEKNMNKLRFSLILLAFLGLSACKTRPLRVEPAIVPAVGSTATAGVGEELVTQGALIGYGRIVLSSDQPIGDKILQKGKYFLEKHTGEYDAFRVPTTHKDAAKAGKPVMLFLFHKDKGTKNACISKTVCGEMEYTLDQTAHFSQNSFHQTLLYSGKIGNRITLGYREFRNDMARQAFSNDVAYDLAESTVLGYKGARIEVIKATNTEITYKILSGFN
jgi:hypothetical protein